MIAPRTAGLAHALWTAVTPPRFVASPATRTGLRYRAAEARGVAPLADVYLPPHPGQAPLPSVVLVHGGGWVIGHRRMKPMRYLATRLLETGHAVMTFDYRLVGRGGRLDAALDDVAAALRWWREGPFAPHLDPARIHLAGLSAGATLAMLHAESARPDDPAPASVISAFGVYDFTTLRGPGIAVLRRAALGPPGPGQARWRTRSAASAPRYPGPVLLLHGAADRLVPLSQHHGLTEARKSADLPVTGHIYADAPHGFFNDAESPAARQATDDILAFLAAAAGG